MIICYGTCKIVFLWDYIYFKWKWFSTLFFDLQRKMKSLFFLSYSYSVKLFISILDWKQRLCGDTCNSLCYGVMWYPQNVNEIFLSIGNVSQNEGVNWNNLFILCSYVKYQIEIWPAKENASLVFHQYWTRKMMRKLKMTWKVVTPQNNRSWKNQTMCWESSRPLLYHLLEIQYHVVEILLQKMEAIVVAI